MHANWHGTSGGYSNHKCRCDACRLAWNKMCRDSKRKRTANFDPNLWEHALEATYQRGCRCDECKAKHAETRRATMYLLSPDEYAAMLEKQGGVCAICKKQSRRLVPDHVHGTQRVRGLLCDGCNTGLGKLGDSEEGLIAALEYLRQS